MVSRMKKLIKIIFVLGLFYLVFQFIVNLFIRTHEVNYSIVTDDNSYNIVEYYNENGYYFNVSDKYNKKFNFYYSESFNKQEKIISNIKYYKTDDLVCIFPIYKKNKTGNLSCVLNNEQVSYSYLKQINNTSILNIVEKLKSLGYDSDEWNYSEEKKIKDGIYVYNKNIDDNYLYTMWFYKGIYIINNNEIIKKQVLDFDSYENKLSRLVGKYYVTFNTDKKNNYQYYEIIIYNIQDSGKKIIELEDVSLNTYINGVYDNKLYFTDIDSRVQYVVDPYESSIKKSDEFIYYNNGKLETIDKNDFFNSEKVFDEFVSNDEIRDKYGNVEIKKYKDNYYFKTDDGRVYEVINNNYSSPILLFKFDDLVEWDVKYGVVSGVSKDTLYTYTNNSGLRPVIVNKELIYNYKNIYDFMKSE